MQASQNALLDPGMVVWAGGVSEDSLGGGRWGSSYSFRAMQLSQNGAAVHWRCSVPAISVRWMRGLGVEAQSTPEAFLLLDRE